MFIYDKPSIRKWKASLLDQLDHGSLIGEAKCHSDCLFNATPQFAYHGTLAPILQAAHISLMAHGPADSTSGGPFYKTKLVMSSVKKQIFIAGSTPAGGFQKTGHICVAGSTPGGAFH